jgi:hypothetical protein
MITEHKNLIYRAFHQAQDRRPYRLDTSLSAALTPPGGEWIATAAPGSVTRSIEWRGRDVALVNPRGDIDDETEGQITMALRALPLLDCAMRTILVLAENGNNIALIREIAETAVAVIEEPAPAIPEPEETGRVQ